jgi:choline kinase
MRPQVVILAAGRGTRLGRPHPKPLTALADGRSIMARQLDQLQAVLPDAQVYVVVGFKLEMILEAHPDNVFVYNEAYDETNTAKSLLRALRATNSGGVLWLNGDLVLQREVLERAVTAVADDRSFVVVNRSAVGEEEVKYTLDADGWIAELAKTVTDGLGEAVGLNYVSAADKASLVNRLDEAGDNDYFERGIELAIEHDGLRFAALDVSDLSAVEVDTPEDLAAANQNLRP